MHLGAEASGQWPVLALDRHRCNLIMIMLRRWAYRQTYWSLQCAKAVTLMNYLTPPPCTSSDLHTRRVGSQVCLATTVQRLISGGHGGLPDGQAALLGYPQRPATDRSCGLRPGPACKIITPGVPNQFTAQSQVTVGHSSMPDGQAQMRGGSSLQRLAAGKQRGRQRRKRCRSRQRHGPCQALARRQACARIRLRLTRPAANMMCRHARHIALREFLRLPARLRPAAM